MKTRAFLAALVALSALPAIAEDGFTPLFDGKTMTGWKNAYDWGKITLGPKARKKQGKGDVFE